MYPKDWLCGVTISIDEMTIGFKGMHIDKRRITYKNEGDSFQCDTLRDDGFVYQVYFRNDPASVKLIKEGISPLHCRVLSLMDHLKDRYHICDMNNLYNSDLFCK